MLISFFFNDTATTEIYTLSLHDALPICCSDSRWNRYLIVQFAMNVVMTAPMAPRSPIESKATGFLKAADRKSTRLNSSHANISYAVFCLKKKKISSCGMTLASYVAVYEV